MLRPHQPTAIGNLLRSLREGAGLSQYEAARLADIDRATLLRIERGETSPSLETINALARVLRIEPETLYDALWSQNSQPLPSLPTYFRRKYHLSGEQIAQVERAVIRATKRDPRNEPRNQTKPST